MLQLSASSAIVIAVVACVPLMLTNVSAFFQAQVPKRLCVRNDRVHYYNNRHHFYETTAATAIYALTGTYVISNEIII